jgi:hypothetical protein
MNPSSRNPTIACLKARRATEAGAEQSPSGSYARRVNDFNAKDSQVQLTPASTWLFDRPVH